ncbi:MAG: hypothetical protein B6I30_04960 [Desulfobacteraceae bacterium 4572_187]|nr:MAG: hypothetical protein B6I30_04960 [Desulfobacteraceae bacterium 4572_187]RLB80524.1 MAG: hypothetical protein DRH24_10470 [Deltaproteobacteria bacterium]
MTTEKTTRIISELLSSLHYSNIEEAGIDMLLLPAQSNYSEFSNDVRLFEDKHHMKFEDFQIPILSRVL